MRIHGFKMKTKPWKHQLRALEYLYPRDCGALYTVPGSGKTKVAIDLIVNRGFKRVLIVAPKAPCEDVWPSELQLHADFDDTNIIPLHNLSGVGKKKKLELALKVPKDKPLIFICNYESVWREPIKQMWFYKRLALDCVICDESHKIKSPGSKCSGFLAQLGNKIPHRYALTGTPLAENPLDVYAQYRFIDRSIFGTSYNRFCAEYTNIDVMASAKIGHTVLDRSCPYKNLDLLRDKMFSCAFSIPPTIKLPKITKMTLRISMDQKTQQIYNELIEEGALEYGEGFLTVNNVLSSIIRRQQVTSGYLPLEYDDGTKTLERISTYRRTALLKLIRGIPKTEPIVIFARFKKDLYSIRMVAKRLGDGYSEVSGSENSLKTWKNGDTRILGVQYGSGAEGINLTRAHICIFYSLDHSLAKYEQALKRIHRPGQSQPCLYYHMVAVKDSGDTIDQSILDALKHKKNYVDLVMKGEKSL